MGQVTVRVGGFSHPVSCEDGQEGHLLNLAAEVDRHVGAVRAMGGQYNEARLLLLAALLLADRVHDLGADLNRARQQGGRAPAVPPVPEPAAPSTGLLQPSGPDPALIARLAAVAERIEGIAELLERD